MPDPLAVVSLDKLVDALRDVQKSNTELAVSMAELKARNDPESLKKEQARDTLHYAQLKLDAQLRTLRLVVLVAVPALIVLMKGDLLQDIFRPRPATDFAQQFKALVDVREDGTREENVKQIRECLDVIQEVLGPNPGISGAKQSSAPASTTAASKPDSSARTDTRISGDESSRLSSKCQILIAR